MTAPAGVTVSDVRAAQALLADVIRPTPLKYNRGLSERVGADVYLKCENLQRAGSFKIRGAYTRMSRLSDAEKAAGVVARSGGVSCRDPRSAASTISPVMASRSRAEANRQTRV